MEESGLPSLSGPPLGAMEAVKPEVAFDGGLKGRLGPSESVDGLCRALSTEIGVGALLFDGERETAEGEEADPLGGMLGMEPGLGEEERVRLCGDATDRERLERGLGWAIGGDPMLRGDDMAIYSPETISLSVQ